jgi:hypothetical protein
LSLYFNTNKLNKENNNLFFVSTRTHRHTLLHTHTQVWILTRRRSGRSRRTGAPVKRCVSIQNVFSLYRTCSISTHTWRRAEGRGSLLPLSQCLEKIQHICDLFLIQFFQLGNLVTKSRVFMSSEHPPRQPHRTLALLPRNAPRLRRRAPRPLAHCWR